MILCIGDSLAETKTTDVFEIKVCRPRLDLSRAPDCCKRYWLHDGPTTLSKGCVCRKNNQAMKTKAMYRDCLDNHKKLKIEIDEERVYNASIRSRQCMQPLLISFVFHDWLPSL